ncbi:capsid protein [Tomato associated geminivirus 2]|nr:capsid protein [Tomato associated geminivirus 2]QFR15873.1 capsid protein [Tomato associated geminivirus 2]
MAMVKRKMEWSKVNRKRSRTALPKNSRVYARKRPILRGPKLSSRDKVYTYTKYETLTTSGAVYHLNSFAQGLANNQRATSVDIVHNVQLRFSVELPVSAMVFCRRYKMSWAVVQDMMPGDSMPAVADIFSMTSPPIEGLEYIADDNHRRFQVKKFGVVYLESGGLDYSTNTGKQTYNVQDALVRKFVKCNTRGVYDSNSPYGSISAMNSGALYFVVNPTFAGYLGFNITVYHNSPV